VAAGGSVAGRRSEQRKNSGRQRTRPASGARCPGRQRPSSHAGQYSKVGYRQKQAGNGSRPWKVVRDRPMKEKNITSVQCKRAGQAEAARCSSVEEPHDQFRASL